MTAFATGWPEHQPDIMVLSLTTHKGVQDFAFNKEQALLIAKTMKETAAGWPSRKRRASAKMRLGMDRRQEDLPIALLRHRDIGAPEWLSALITTVCLLPCVVSEMLALKPAPLARTWKLPPPPRPCEIAVDVAAGLAPGARERCRLRP